MAQVIRTKGGYLTHRLTKSEQEQLWKELSVDVSPVGKYSLYTPQDDLEYFIIRETETSFEKYEAEIRANGKTPARSSEEKEVKFKFDNRKAQP